MAEAVFKDLAMKQNVTSKFEVDSAGLSETLLSESIASSILQIL